MKVSTILDHIDNGHMALPEFQRGYVWNRDQVRGFMDSLYRRHPVGSLLVWVTESKSAEHRGGQELPPGVVKLLLDGQQRMTSLYGVVRGRAPKFFDGNEKAFTGLYFHLENEEFAFYSPIKMKDDPLWVDVTSLMQDGMGGLMQELLSGEFSQDSVSKYFERLNAIAGLATVEFHVDEVTGADKTIDVVVEIFNRVNSGGTKLSKGDLALAKVCAEWPDAREAMKKMLGGWAKKDYHFNLDWLLRCVNTVLTGEARFTALHGVDADEFQTALKKTESACDYLLNVVSGRFGLDHDRVLFGRYAFPVMAHYVDRRGGKLTDAQERDKLLFWYLQSALWGRFSGSTESVIDKDLKLLEDLDGGLDRLIEELKLWRGDLVIRPEHFGGWSLGARFYPMLYLLTRVGEALDWGTGVALKAETLGKLSRLEVHHIFPKSQLYAGGYKKADVNAVANFCFLTQESNLEILDKPPEEYFEKIAANFPGALESQWIPMDKGLWKIENYLSFLEARKQLLADSANRFLAELLHVPVADFQIEEVAVQIQAAADLKEPIPAVAVEQLLEEPTVVGGVESELEERLIRQCDTWVRQQGFPAGQFMYEIVDERTGTPIALLDLAWPNGLQEGLSQPAALLLDEGPATYAAANMAGFRYFISVEAFKEYVETEVLGEEAGAMLAVSG